MPAEGILILTGLLMALSVGGLFAALMMPREQVDPFRQRLERIAVAGPRSKQDAADARRGPRGKSVKETLREIEEAQRQRKRLTLLLRLRQAGLDWQKPRYFALCAGIGLAALTLTFAAGVQPAIAAGFGVAAGIGLPEAYLRILRRGRLRVMAEEFPNAVDIIVRGVKSGLPLADCLRIIAREAREPLRGEFAKIVRDQAVGLPIDEAVERFARRVPLSEANFFAIVITIQNRTGGSLSESLTNLSTVLRERKKMRGKIRAMSSEAKASGGIIGALPIVVTLIVYLTSPDYMTLLFDTMIGQLVIGLSLLWMLIGVLVMRQMINFDF